MLPLKDLFLLDHEIHFLNHGSFGACPRPVFAAYQDWQRRLERQPVLFLGREFPALDCQARAVLGKYLNTHPDNLAFIPNATYGANAVARSLDLLPGDEILTTDHEYGACDKTWDFVARKTGARVVRQPIPLPLSGDRAAIVAQFWQGVTARTRAIYLSHITSPTALCLPVELICQRARAQGLVTIVDGAHAPGQAPLDLDALGADYYFGNLHKWMLSPKGAAFLYVHSERQANFEPLVVSWGYQAAPNEGSGSQFVDYYQWTGTRDPAAALSVPAAIEFMAGHNWEAVRTECHALLRPALERICNLVGLEPPYPLDSDFYFQMAAAPLPLAADLVALKRRLYDEFRVEVPLIDWHGHKFVRISVQGYNTPDDLEALYAGLKELLPDVLVGASPAAA